MLQKEPEILTLLNEAQHIARIGSWNWDIASGEVWWSDELYNIFEVDKTVYIPTFQSIAEFVHPEDSEEYFKAASKSLETGEMLDRNLRIVTNGRIKHCRSLARVYFDENGKAKRMTGAFLDISEQVNIVNELQESRERAEESDRLKTAFLQNISHEVRTPLNSIVGFSELLSEPGQPLHKVKSFTKIISANSSKLLRIISDVIEISQIHSGLVKLVLSRFDLISMLYKVVDLFMEITQLKEVEFIIKMGIREEQSRIISDKGKFEKILFHLVDNAVKFTHKGSISINATINDGTFDFEISDTGIGIPAEKQSSVFDPFRQVETGLNRSYGGAGLGLTIVKAYTDALKGRISLKSEPGSGTTVSVSIPVTLEPFNGASVNDQADKVNTILIAEDEYSNYRYLYELLHSDKTRILHAANGKEALDLCRNSDDIQMILMDLKMPVMDGTAAAKLIKEIKPGLPIIAQTAYIPDEGTLNSIFDDVIEKPINRNDLKKKMSKYINV